MITIKYNQVTLTLPAPAPTTLEVSLRDFAAPLLSVLGLPSSTVWRIYTSVVDGATYDLAFYIEPAPEPVAPEPAPAPAPAPTPEPVAPPAAPAPAPAPAPTPELATPATLTVLVKYGIGNTVSRVAPVGTTIGALLADPQVKGALGYGTNVQGFVAGVPQGNNIPLRDSDVVSVHDVACTKA